MIKKENKFFVKAYEQRKIKEDPLFRRKRWLKLKYNITIEQYKNLLLSQDFLCAICGTQMEEKDICIDHCHTTGKVRGLLHRTCNAAIGLLKEDINILANAISYLNNNK